jgi:hypothetical protein
MVCRPDGADVVGFCLALAIWVLLWLGLGPKARLLPCFRPVEPVH